MVRPLIATKGKSLTKDQLTEGMKQDENLHTLIATEYNKNIPEYAGNAHPDVEEGRNSNPGSYSPIAWQKSKTTFTSLCNEYDKCFYNWKRSGFHGKFLEEDGAEEGTEAYSEKSPFPTLCKVIIPCCTCTVLCINFQIAFIRSPVSQH